MNFALITSAIAAACGFGLAWQLQAHQILKINSEAKDAVIVQQRNARAALERATTQVITAQNNAVVRNARNRVDAVRAGDSGSGLRIASTGAVRAAAEDTSACLPSIATYDIVLSESIGFIREVARDADGWQSDAVMLWEGWVR